AAAPVAAHRAVLAASSPYFRAMFTQFDERTQPTITIQDVEPQALEAIIDYVYDPDSLVITEDNVQVGYCWFGTVLFVLALTSVAKATNVELNRWHLNAKPNKH
ncbi:jg23188, partial [Pararge aegeria aegeria]